MTDSTLNSFFGYGTEAAVLAVSPSPPTPAVGLLPLYIFRATDTGEVWLYDTAFRHITTLGAQLVLTGTISPTSLAADQNDYNPTGLGTCSIIRQDAGANYNITGLVAPSIGGQTIFFANISTHTITLKDQNASSSAANRFDLGGADVAITTKQLVILQYDATSARWRCVASGSGGSGVTPAKVLITETVTSSSAANVTFSGIPSTYRDLEIRIRGRNDAAGGNKDRNIYLQFNGDTGSNYISTSAYIQNGGAGQVGAGAATTQIIAGFLLSGAATANYSSQCIINIGDYKGTTFYKSVSARGGEIKSTTSTEQNAQIEGGLWLSTSAITSVKVYFDSGNFVNNSVVSLYGHY